jgi:hypothetical protein
MNHGVMTDATTAAKLLADYREAESRRSYAPRNQGFDAGYAAGLLHAIESLGIFPAKLEGAQSGAIAGKETTMRNEKADTARSKPNRGQDEVMHTMETPTGETVEVSQRDWKENYRGVEGYRRVDENAPDEAAEVGTAPVSPEEAEPPA